MKSKLFFFLILLLVLPLISSASCVENNLGTFKQGEIINLRQTCDTCSFVNLSGVTIPNSTTIYFNEMMNKTGIEYNYQFTNTLTIGNYFYTVLGDKGGIDTSETLCFEITPMGESNSMVFFILIYFLFYGITILGLIKKHEWITLGGCFGLLVLGVYTGINGIAEYKNSLTDVVSYITLLIGLGLGFETLYEITNY